jgi:hypothetical protein
VDSLVRGYPQPPEIRYRTESGEIKIEKPAPTPQPYGASGRGTRRNDGVGGQVGQSGTRRQQSPIAVSASSREVISPEENAVFNEQILSNKPVKLYPYGVARNRLQQAAKRLGVPVIVARDIGDAQSLITLRSYYRNRQATIMEAEERGMPIYVLRANTVNQIEQFLAEIFNLADGALPGVNSEGTIEQTQAAIQAVLNGERYIDLPPAASSIRRLQHDLARQAQLISQSYGKEPYRRVRIYRE